MLSWPIRFDPGANGTKMNNNNNETKLFIRRISMKCRGDLTDGRETTTKKKTNRYKEVKQKTTDAGVRYGSAALYDVQGGVKLCGQMTNANVYVI
ncbi:hypothetical protein GWI33_002919 [Rhynchophorus ferrugineus]|uniref:Uncharacterized protein n=1 Tax=Rhynchophorus ferrugineus TaxID=354439 RepID=A0A834IY95_RHYFE|nr:hypothetical protein GWI33_002919 [Rhynchophorus ferrugineus]